MADKIPKEWLSIITNEVVKSHEHQKVIENKKREDWKLRNTSLLLKNYRMLKSHCNGIIEDLEIYEAITYNSHELDLNTLMRYKAKTAKMLDYFESMLGSYKSHCDKMGESAQRRFKAIYKLYIDATAMTKSEVGVILNVDESTIRRDEKKAIEELSIYLFGIESLNDLVDA